VTILAHKLAFDSGPERGKGEILVFFMAFGAPIIGKVKQIVQ
jgi:hypothetical protein